MKPHHPGTKRRFCLLLYNIQGNRWGILIYHILVLLRELADTAEYSVRPEHYFISARYYLKLISV